LVLRLILRAEVVRRVTMSITSAVSQHPVAADAVAELSRALGDTAELYGVFVTNGYDLDAVGAAIEQWCGGRVFGCTSAGNIGPAGYALGGITAVAFTGGDLQARTVSIGPLTDVADAVDDAASALADLRPADRRPAESRDPTGRASFAVLLADSLTQNEDRLAATLSAVLGDVPMIGGCAGDDYASTGTAVYLDGRFVPDHATLTLVTTTTPFRLFRLQHHEHTDFVLVATDADPDRRVIHEFNGRPAATAYAHALGLTVDALTPAVLAAHPLMLRAGGSSWVRTVAALHLDGSFAVLAAVDRGDVLRVGNAVDVLGKVEATFAALHADLGPFAGVLAFDCVLRRVEFEEMGLDDRVGRVLAKNRVVGCSTNGELFNGMHMNQTLLGVAFGGGVG
jgi:hypothetical protein